MALAAYLILGAYALFDAHLGLTDTGEDTARALGLRPMHGIGEYAFLGLVAVVTAGGIVWAAWPLVRRRLGLAGRRPSSKVAAEMLARLEFEVDQAKERARDDPEYRRLVVRWLNNGAFPRDNALDDYAAVLSVIGGAGAPEAPDGERFRAVRELEDHLARLRRDLERAANEAEKGGGPRR